MGIFCRFYWLLDVTRGDNAMESFRPQAFYKHFPMSNYIVGNFVLLSFRNVLMEIQAV